MSTENRDRVRRALREFRKYEGDGQGGTGALPIGDPASGPHNPPKSLLREALEPVALGLDSVNTSVSAAAASASASAQSAQESADAKEGAEAAAQAAGAAIYDDTTAGLAATVDGDIFLVPGTNTLIVYRNDSGVATELTTFGGFTQSGTGAVARTVDAKLKDRVSIRDFGAVADGTTPANDAVLAMAAAVGYVRVEQGGYLLNDITIDVPLIFEKGSHFIAAATQTVTIQAEIESPRQWIFRGDGGYSLGHASGGSGEEARMVHVSWFGAFTTTVLGPDQAPFISKAFASMGNLRESVIKFDVGNYNVASSIEITRGGWVKGAGGRRTVFKISGAGYDVFKTIGPACKFSEIQFELHPGESPRSTGSLINIDEIDCDIFDTNVRGDVNKGFVVTGNNARIHRINAVYGAYPGAGSSLVHLAAGASHNVTGIQATTSAFGPDSIVHVGSAAAGNMSGIQISDINHVLPSISVLIDAVGGNIVRSGASKLLQNGGSGSHVVKVVTSGAHTVEDLGIDGIIASASVPNCILFEQNSTGRIRRVNVANVEAQGGSGYGIGFVRTAGVLEQVTVADTVNVKQHATPFFYSGTSTEIRISPAALPAANSNPTFDYTIPDDGVAVLTLNRSVFTGAVLLTVGGTRIGLYGVRAASGPAGVTAFATTGLATATTALTGTTGTDGNFTMGITSGVLYFENRLGSSQRVSVTLMTGVI